MTNTLSKATRIDLLASQIEDMEYRANKTFWMADQETSQAAKQNATATLNTTAGMKAAATMLGMGGDLAVRIAHHEAIRNAKNAALLEEPYNETLAFRTVGE